MLAFLQIGCFFTYQIGFHFNSTNFNRCVGFHLKTGRISPTGLAFTKILASFRLQMGWLSQFVCVFFLQNDGVGLCKILVLFTFSEVSFLYQLEWLSLADGFAK